MAKGLWVALGSNNALTDTNPDHFSLYTDTTEDYVLIKEKNRGSISNDSTPDPIEHDLGYAPFFMAFIEESSGVFRWVHGLGIYDNFNAYATTADLFLGTISGTKTFKYYIFYDEV